MRQPALHVGAGPGPQASSPAFFSVGVVVATQNPMDLDYRALSNAGPWCLGRLQTDADRARVIDGLANKAGQGRSAGEMEAVLKQLRPRWFVVRDAQGDRRSC